MTIYYTMPYNGQSVLNTLTMVFNKKILTGLILIFGIQSVVGNQVSENGSQICRGITADLEIKNLILNNLHTATPCACFERQMELDYSFQKIGTCYKQWFSENGLKQMCCYNAYGSLLLGPKNGGYLIPDVLEPDIVNIHEACCEDVDLCKQFYQTFPSNNCSGSTNIKHATSWGDPEITTVDHHTYSFNGHGEYTFLETDNKSLQIQARTDFLIKGNKDATIFVAFVLADNLKNDNITIVYNRTDKLLYLYQHDGSLWRNSNGSKAPGQSEGFQLFPAPPYSFTIMLKQKTSIRQIVFSGGEFMSVTFTTSGNNVTGFKGLAGNWQQGNYIAGNGTMVDGNATTESQMFELGETWTVSKGDSKFNYDITGGNFTYWNENHTTPRFLQEIAEKGDLASLFKGFSEANITKYNRTCRNSWDQQPNIQCLVTIAKTGDVARGEAVRDDAEDKHHNYLINHNKPPQFKNCTPTFLNVTYGGKSSELDLKLCVTDDFDSANKLTYKVITELKNYTLENGTFKWNVDEYLRYRDTSLTFTVNDTLGFSTARSMKIFYCGCENPSQCDFSYFNGNSSANIQKASCECPAYSGGLYCEVQLDPCDDYTCYETCDGSFSRSLPTWPCAECPIGRISVIASYNQTCDNIDECKAEPKPCGQLCNDTDGSYKCYCEEGFQLNVDSHTCDDVDECRSPPLKCTGENEVCLNTRGNFSCICEPGYSKKNGVCKERVGSTYVGHMSFAVSVAIKDINVANKEVDTPENRQEVQMKLEAGFKNTDGFVSVEVFRLSVVVINRKRRATYASEKFNLRADYVVHWENETDNKVIGDKLSDSFKNFTDHREGGESNLEIANVKITLRSAENHINNATTEGGLCTVPDKTDCAPDSTTCIDKDNGEFECRCKSGYTPARLNKKYCTDIDECKAFGKTGTTGQRCVHGSCHNSGGSWNCSCQANRQWQSVGNDTYPVYRCQGNFSYIGNLSFFWRGLGKPEAIIKFIQVQLKGIYTNKSLENTSYPVPISSLFVSATVLSLVEDTSDNYYPMQKFNVMFNLRMGEPVESDRVSNVMHTAFNGESLHIPNSKGLDVTFIDTSYSMFNDSDNVLCHLTSNGNCDPATTDCRQHNGTTNCECKDGYKKLHPSEKFCIDIDECHTTTNTCNNETCVNLPGNWTCKCKNSSFVPDQDDRNNFTCKEKAVSQCKIHNDFKCDGGERKCINDTWQCNCSRGYHPENNSDTLMTCKDIDECLDTTKNCSGRGKCVNTPKGYTCSCDSGYLKDDTDPYNVSCNDIDECSNSSYSCGGKCNNSLGSWDCDCADGYQAKANSNFSITCEDINECTVNHIDCSGHGNCSNLPGGYTCLCADGFILNDTTKSCEDIDECHLPQSTLPQYVCGNGTCSNTNGSWSCSCPEFGYRRHEFSQDVIVCEDIDECSDSSYHCGGTCYNTVGSWSCKCDSGYTREPDKARHAKIIACEDIYECDRDSACIDGVCKNTDGSWTCVCKDGKEPKPLNSSTIICSGGYQYIATIGITITTPKGNKDHELRVYLETQIQSAYETKFPQQNVRVEIISISSGGDSRKKRQTSENLKVEFILHFDEPVESENITSAWHDFKEQNCTKGICKPKKNDVAVDLPFSVIFADDVEFNEDQQTKALCDIPTNNHCDTDSTICQYVNGNLNCECKKGYTRKTDYECTVQSDACNKSPCQNGGTCQMINENTDDIDFECICRDGWTGKTCEDVQKRIVKPPETVHKTVLIATGSSLGAVVIILAIIVSVVCRWKAAKVKEAEKMSMKNLDNNDFKSFDGSFINTQYMREGQSMPYDRNSLNSYRLSNASLPYIQHNGGSRPQKLPRTNFHGSMPNLANGNAHFNRSDNRRYSVEEPKRFSSYNQRMESQYDTDWRARRNNFTGRRSPSPDYGRRSSPEPDYHRMENPNRSKDSGVGNGYSSESNDYRRPDKRGEYYYGNRRSTQF